MKRALVTGASGFVGRASLEPLLRRGFEAHAVGFSRDHTSGASVHWHHVDLLNQGAVFDLCETVRPTHLLHFAWYAQPGKFWHALENFAWVSASLALLEAFHRVGGRRAVIAGTCAEYDWRYGCCVEGVTPLVPASTYGVCKFALSALAASFASQTGVSVAWGRIFSPFGPYEYPERLVSYVIGSLLRGEVALCTRGDQLRDFLIVDDVADAFAALLDSTVAGPVNIGSGEPTSISSLLQRIAARLGRRDLLRLGAREKSGGDAPIVLADVTRLHEEVGWSPTYSLDQAIDRCIDYWRDTLPRVGAASGNSPSK
jgi:nucleoside-diphosphate-sugar epimerase